MGCKNTIVLNRRPLEDQHLPITCFLLHALLQFPHALPPQLRALAWPRCVPQIFDEALAHSFHTWTGGCLHAIQCLFGPPNRSKQWCVPLTCPSPDNPKATPK